jgi:hypothetical protein
MPSAEAPLALSPEIQAMIAGLPQTLPAVAGAAATSSGAYLVRFAPHISAQLATGQATLMQAVEGGARAIAVDAQGSILAHGTLIPLSGLNPVLAAAALWQVAAMATAQHYLVTMQQQLARIEAAINELRAWLEDREVAGLVTSARYLQDALAAHASAQPPALPDSVANQVEQIAREAAQVVEARRLTLARTTEHVRSLPLSDPIWWNVERNVQTLRETLASADQDMHVGAMGLAVWAVASETRRMLAGASGHNQSDCRRLADARAQLGDAHRQVGDIAKSRSDSIDAPSDVRRVLPNLQQLVRAEVDAAADLRALHLSPVDQMLALRTDQAHTDSGQSWHSLVARRAASGSWELTPYREAANQAAPSPAPIAADVFRRLLRVPMLNLASLDSAKRARPRFQLRNGMTINTWRNLAGFNHVFVTDASGRAVFGGFVPWDNRELKVAIRDIRRLYA